jgi:NADH:ubiquinone reductase (non-electrogenic)
MHGDRLFWAVAKTWLRNKPSPPLSLTRNHQTSSSQFRRPGSGVTSRNYSSTSGGSAGEISTVSSRTEKPAGFFSRIFFGGGRPRENGVRPPGKKTYLFAIAAATGCLGAAGLYVVLADAGQDHVAADSTQESSSPKKKVVILGTGWAGMSFLKNLDSKLYDVRIVSPRNYFVFTPLLPSVTVGTVEARSITEPIRRIIRKKEAQFHEAECIKIDAENKKVACKDVSDITFKGKEEFVLDYDYLVIAVGATSNTFGTKGVMEYCHFLKDIEDAEKIREHIINCFETASLPHLSSQERQKLLNFVVVGGGPTGVEFSAELHDLVHEDLLCLYPHLKDDVKITLVQSGDHILNTFDERISQFAEKKFSRDGVHVKIGCRVLEVTDEYIKFKAKDTGKMVDVPYGMIVWSTGISTRPVIADFMKQIGQEKRRVLATDEWLRVKNCDGVYALGDCASIEQRKIVEDIAYIFKQADKDNNGLLSAAEFVETMEEVRLRYPQIDLYMDHKHMKGVIGLLDEALNSGDQHNTQLDLEHFSAAMSKVDSLMKCMPATAQVAAQEGTYLAHSFNHIARHKPAEGPKRIRAEGRHRFNPFCYRHLGQFAPLGGEQAAAELPGDWVSIGRSTMWLWYSVYASKQVSWRTRALVMFDWTKRFVFGRDSSRM